MLETAGLSPIQSSLLPALSRAGSTSAPATSEQQEKSYFKDDDQAEFSEQAQALGASPGKEGLDEEDAEKLEGEQGSTNENDSRVDENEERDQEKQVKESKNQGTRELSEHDQQIVEKLKARDQEVRAHEQAHLAAAGALANGGPKFEYQNGPDGKRYAVGGHVNVDVGPVPGDPEATILKADQIKRSALAPEDPSSQDQRIAAKADQMKAEAQAELARSRLEEGADTAVPTGTADAAKSGEDREGSEPSEKSGTHGAEAPEISSQGVAGVSSGKLDSPLSQRVEGSFSASHASSSAHASYQRVASGSLSDTRVSIVA